MNQRQKDKKAVRLAKLRRIEDDISCNRLYGAPWSPREALLRISGMIPDNPYARKPSWEEIAREMQRIASDAT